METGVNACARCRPEMVSGRRDGEVVCAVPGWSEVL